jgi:hypothetical protein
MMAGLCLGAPCWGRATRCSVPQLWARIYAADGSGVSHTYSASSTSDFASRGDLLLGLIDDQQSGFAGGAGFRSMQLTIEANGAEILDTTFRSLGSPRAFFRARQCHSGANAFAASLSCQTVALATVSDRRPDPRPDDSPSDRRACRPEALSPQPIEACCTGQTLRIG